MRIMRSLPRISSIGQSLWGDAMADSARAKSGKVTAAPSGEGDAKDAALHSRPAPPGSPKNAGSIARRPRDFTSLSTIYCGGAILDSYRPSQYGPRGFRGRNYRDLA